MLLTMNHFVITDKRAKYRNQHGDAFCQASAISCADINLGA